MEITKENYNEYVRVADELLEHGFYAEAASIASEAMDIVDEWDEIEDNLEYWKTFCILTSAQWQSVDYGNPEARTYFAELLRHNSYWSDEFIEAEPEFIGPWILRQKSLAYYSLARNWGQGELQDLYFEYAQTYMQKAIDTYAKSLENESEPDEDPLIYLLNESKIDLAMIETSVSNRTARETAISLLGIDSLEEDQRKRVMDIYEKSTDVLFKNYFADERIATLNSLEIAGEEVKKDIIKFFIEDQELPDKEDLYWMLFTHVNTPQERNRIRFVERIETATDNDFEEIPWVFTLDRYPSDIEFANGERPTEDSVYEIDPENPNLYHKISK